VLLKKLVPANMMVWPAAPLEGVSDEMTGGPAGPTARVVDVDGGGEVEDVGPPVLCTPLLPSPVDAGPDEVVVAVVERAAGERGAGLLLRETTISATAAATTSAPTAAMVRANQRSCLADGRSGAGRWAGGEGVGAGRAPGGGEVDSGPAPVDSRARRTALSMAPRARTPGVPGGGSALCSSAISPLTGTCSPNPGIHSRHSIKAPDQETVMRSDLISRPRPLRPQQPPAGEPSPSGGVAAAVAPLLAHFFAGPPPVRFEFWDGTSLGPTKGDTVQVRSPDAVRRLLWSPGELGLARAFVIGDIAFEGDIFEILAALHGAAPERIHVGSKLPWQALRAARRLGVVGRPLPSPPEEAAPRGRIHSRGRDAQAVQHHYDVSNDFYAMVLGPAMTYSCARFSPGADTLEAAQESKHDLVCRKLGLAVGAGQRILDVGCGWGSFAIHAARHYGARVVGITLSPAQARWGRERVAAAGLDEQIEIRLQDYRDVADGPFDGIASVGMFEHVGSSKSAEYFATMRRLLGPEGRLLNHAISSVGGSRIGPRTFIGRYVFPDGELIDVGQVVLSMEEAGFEVRDVESLREHYAKTLRAWVANLRGQWDAAVAEVGVRRARVWQLYMAASANGFEDSGISIHQVLGVVPGPGGQSGMSPTRSAWG
jgi:cyclopropane-fatty-acyl-phospholipid synthase